jgi:hypothetical protein
MNIWEQAEEILNTIQLDLHEDPPAWERAARSTEKVKALIPGFPTFQGFAEGQALQMADVRIANLRRELEYLKQGLLKQDRELALGSAASALRLVQALGRKEA